MPSDAAVQARSLPTAHFQLRFSSSFSENGVWDLWHGHVLMSWGGQYITAVAAGRSRKKKKKFLKSCTEQRERKKTVSWQSYWQGCLKKIKEASKKKKARNKYSFSRESLRIVSKPGAKSLLREPGVAAGTADGKGTKAKLHGKGSAPA